MAKERRQTRQLTSTTNRLANVRRLARTFPTKTLRALLISEALREAMWREKLSGETPADEIVATAILQASQGDKDARAWVTDRYDGPLRQQVTVEFTGPHLAIFDLACDTVAQEFGDDPRVEKWISVFTQKMNALRGTGYVREVATESEPSG